LLTTVFASRTAPVVIPAFCGAMDNCTHHPIPSPKLASPAPAPQEATGDSESDAPVSASTVGDRRPSVAAAYAEHDAESCSGAGGDKSRVDAASVDDDDGRGAHGDVVDVEADENEEVDSRMSVPWWRRMVQNAAGSASGGSCARPQAAAAAEGGAAAVVAGPGHTAESNRLFWEACVARGY